jgi:hypothetical protein
VDGKFGVVGMHVSTLKGKNKILGLAVMSRSIHDWLITLDK